MKTHVWWPSESLLLLCILEISVFGNKTDYLAEPGVSDDIRHVEESNSISEEVIGCCQREWLKFSEVTICRLPVDGKHGDICF